MPNPKRRHSKSRRGKRRAHDFLQTVTPGVCPNCQNPKPPHQACAKCGYYKGKQVMEAEEEY
ncbi:MAG: 50S ribosomal protein L32 [Acidobacteriota bacterium]|nr:50S ribosomal protein L32 [Acidobacteriota bacterium]